MYTGKNLLVVGRNEEGSLSLAAYFLWKLLLGVTNSRKFMGKGKKKKVVLSFLMTMRVSSVAK